MVAVVMEADAPVASVRAVVLAALVRAHAALVLVLAVLVLVLATLAPATLVLATLVLVRSGRLKAALQLLAECGSAANEREFVR
jgi:hypothetical protein